MLYVPAKNDDGAADALRRPLFLAAAIAAADQCIKIYVDKNFVLGESIPVVSEIFHLTYIRNPGAAFSLLANQTAFFIVTAIALFAALAYFYPQLKRENAFNRYGAMMIAGGAAGNLIDRIRLGEVIDYLDFRIWPVFNLADIFITVGVALIMYAIVFLDDSNRKVMSEERGARSEGKNFRASAKILN